MDTHPATPILKGPPRALLYVRVSKERDQDEGSQVLALSDWCATRGWQVVQVERDRMTGDLQRRRAGDPPGMRRALQALAERRADVLVVFAADRLVRSPIGLVQLVARIQSLGAKVASYQDGHDLDTTTDVGELLTFFRGWWARMELKLIRARTVAGMARARQQGRLPGPKPKRVFGVRVLREGSEGNPGLSWRELGQLAGVSAATARRRYHQQLVADQAAVVVAGDAAE